MLGTAVAGSAGSDWAAWANVIAAGIVALATWRGLSAWKREHREKRNMQLAEEVLALAYECLDVIEWLRHGWMPAYELDAVPKIDGETDDAYRIRRTYEVVFVRYQKHAEKFAQLRSLRYRVEVFFGKSHRDAIEAVQRLAEKIKGAAQDAHSATRSMHSIPNIDGRSNTYQRLLDQKNKAENTLWGMDPGQDVAGDQIAELRRYMEALFKHAAATGELVRHAGVATDKSTER